MNVEPEEKKILPRFGVYVCRNCRLHPYVSNAVVPFSVYIDTADIHSESWQYLFMIMKEMHTGKKLRWNFVILKDPR